MVRTYKYDDNTFLKKLNLCYKKDDIRPDKIKYLILVLFFSKYGAGGRILFLFFTQILKFKTKGITD